MVEELPSLLIIVSFQVGHVHLFLKELGQAAMILPLALPIFGLTSGLDLIWTLDLTIPWSGSNTVPRHLQGVQHIASRVPDLPAHIQRTNNYRKMTGPQNLSVCTRH